MTDKMKLGLSSFTYTWAIGVPGSMPGNPLSPRDLISRTSNAGLRLVQIADNLPLESLTSEELEKLHEHAVMKDVSIEMGGRGLSSGHTMKCLETAEKIKSPILRMVIDGKEFEPDLRTVIAIIKELLPEFKSRNIRLAIENHDRFSAVEFEKIIIAVGSESVGICLDTVNSLGAGEGFRTVSNILIPYTINLHIKDFTIFRAFHKMGLIIEGKPAGKGMLNISELVSILQETGRCQSAILELWTPPEDTLDDTIERESSWADESIVFLKSIFKIP